MIHINGGSTLRFVKTCLFVAMLTAMVLAGAACRQEAHQQTGVPEKITIAYSATTGPGLVQLAFAKGFFMEEGLDVIPQIHSFGKLALKSMLDNKADLASAADTPLMFAVMGGKKISIIAAIHTSGRNTAIVAWQDRGITTPSDLQGKKIGVTKGTSSDFFLEAFMSVYNIDPRQEIIIDLKPEEMSEALSTRRVDAVVIFNPFLARFQEKLGKMGCTFYGETIFTEYFCLAARQEYVHEHPEAIRKALRALIKAEAFVRHHPEESRRLIAEFIKVDKTLIDRIWPDLSFRITLDQGLLVDLEDQTRWAIKNNLTNNTVKPNYLDFIYTDSLLAIKPEAVRIIH